MLRKGEFVCPTGLEISTKVECGRAFGYVKWTYGQLQNKRILQEGPWNGVPFGCSIQFGLPSDATYYQDYSPHWNTKADTSNSRSVNNEFVTICKQPSQDVYVMLPKGSSECCCNKKILTSAECGKAYAQLQRNNPHLQNKRNLQIGGWNGVPYGCSIQYGLFGDSYFQDYSPHWNSNKATNNARRDNFEFISICKA